MMSLLRLLTRGASCTRLGHEWFRTGFRTFQCRWCHEPGFDASPERVEELQRRWSQ